MFAYDPSEWTDLFVAAAGASAALAGLVFVAVSINIQRILEYPGLPERALETLALLVGVLIVAIVCLIPGVSRAALGTELLFVSGALACAIVSFGTRVRPNPGDPPQWSRTHWVVRLVGVVPLVIGAASVLIGSGGGLYWVAAGIVFAILAAVTNAWVLLVEILR